MTMRIYPIRVLLAILVLAAPLLGQTITGTTLVLTGGSTMPSGLYLWDLNLQGNTDIVTLEPYVPPVSLPQPPVCTPALGVNWINGAWQCVTVAEIQAALGISAGTQFLVANTDYINFGDVTVGQNATILVTLTSTGTQPVTIATRPLIGGEGYSFTGGNFPASLAPNQSVILQVEFAPPVAGTFTGTMTVDNNSTNSPILYVNFTGTGVVP